MMIATVTGNVFATRKNGRFVGKKLLVVRELGVEGQRVGPSFLAVDRVDAGIGDRVLINKEGSGARLLFGDDEIPLQAVVVGVVDDLALETDGE